MDVNALFFMMQVLLPLVAGVVALSIQNANFKKIKNGLIIDLEQKVEKALKMFWINSEPIYVLQEKDELLSPDDGVTNYVKRVVVARNRQARYVLGVFFSNRESFVLYEIDELRARRALFLHPTDYLQAFGEMPNAKRIRQIEKLNNKLKQFNLQVHGGELMEAAPVGAEIHAIKS